MGDPRRFSLFANLIAKNFDSRLRVAGGKGHLQAVLRGLAFEDIITSEDGENYRYEWFSFNHHRKEFGLVVGMHKVLTIRLCNNRVPFAHVVSGSCFWDRKNFANWIKHLKSLAPELKIEEVLLPMSGKNLVLISRPAA